MDVRLYETPDVLKTACQLTEKLYGQNKRVLIICQNPLAMTALDQMLWSFKQLSFLPHMTDIDKVDPKNQPIFLTCQTNQNLNDAEIVIFCNTISASCFHENQKKEVINGIVGIFDPNQPFIQKFVDTYPPNQRFTQTVEGGWK